MKNSFGNTVTVTVFGESHGPFIGATLDGLSPGVKVDEEYISNIMLQRAPFGTISTQRHESDKAEIISGVFNGYTEGTPITVIIKNENTVSKDYSYLKLIPRPGHADYTAEVKYNGYQDYRGGGHFSGRTTCGIAALGAICRTALLSKGIKIGTHISEIHGIEDKCFCDFESDIDAVNGKQFAVLDDSIGEKMQEEINFARRNSDSVGGVLETAIIGLEAGVGEPWFDSIESMLSHALFAIPGVKGVSFGDGFSLASMYGSEANDSLFYENEKVKFRTNSNGGINGGISNGMPITIKTAVKPTPSISKEQDSVNLETKKNAILTVSGRHDPCIVHRVRSVVDALCAITLCDFLETKHGINYFCEDRYERS